MLPVHLKISHVLISFPLHFHIAGWDNEEDNHVNCTPWMKQNNEGQQGHGAVSLTPVRRLFHETIIARYSLVNCIHSMDKHKFRVASIE
jgi:hypothetical protein